MKYILTEEAKFDLINIHQYGVFRFGEKQADKYFFAFFEQFGVIAKKPYLFPSVDYIRKRYRKCVCGVDTIYYRVNGKTVEIITIIGRQDIKNKIKKG